MRRVPQPGQLSLLVFSASPRRAYGKDMTQPATLTCVASGRLLTLSVSKATWQWLSLFPRSFGMSRQ